MSPTAAQSDDADSLRAAPPPHAVLAVTSLTDASLRAVCRHAMTAHPCECCGTISNGVVRPSSNVRAGGDTSDAGRRAFELDAAGAIAVAEAALETDIAIIVYHSHPNGDALFSDTDARAAAPQGKPTYPDLYHLVIGCTAIAVSEARLYSYHAGAYARLAYWSRTDLTHILDADSSPHHRHEM